MFEVGPQSIYRKLLGMCQLPVSSKKLWFLGCPRDCHTVKGCNHSLYYCVDTVTSLGHGYLLMVVAGIGIDSPYTLLLLLLLPIFSSLAPDLIS